VLAACGKKATVEKTCAPRTLDAAPRCDGAADDAVIAATLEGPETGGDQGANVCFGLLLETTHASGVTCRQRIGSFSSIGMGDDVWIDGEPVCMRIGNDAIVVERKGKPIARAPHRGAAPARTYPERCK